MAAILYFTKFKNNSSLVKFLTKKFEQGASYGTLNSYRSAISLISPNKIGDDQLISRFLKGVFKLKPSFPKYSFTWDVSIVLNHIAKFFPLENLTFEKLTLKTVMLLSLATAQRAQTLATVRLQNILVTPDQIQIRIQDILKTAAPGREQPLLTVPFLRSKPELCVASTLLKYIKTSSNLRNKSDKLFISLKKSYKPVSTQTISRWIKLILTESGINTNVFESFNPSRRYICSPSKWD